MASKIAQGSNSIAFAYGPEHQRYKQCVPNCTSPTNTVYYLNDPITGAGSEEYVSGSNTVWHDYVVAPGQGIVAVRTNNGGTISWRYLLNDHLGSTTVLTNTASPNGQVAERDSYDAWGNRRNPNGNDSATCSLTSQTSRGYTGQEMLDTFCLVDLNARLYDPRLARFLSPDSMVPNPANTQSYNRYSYTNNNPLNATDPTGHEMFVCTANSTCGGSATGDAGIGLYGFGGIYGPTGSMADYTSAEAKAWGITAMGELLGGGGGGYAVTADQITSYVPVSEEVDVSIPNQFGDANDPSIQIVYATISIQYYLGVSGAFDWIGEDSGSYSDTNGGNLGFVGDWLGGAWNAIRTGQTRGTIQAGVGVNFTWRIPGTTFGGAFIGSFGVALDTHLNVAGYASYGGAGVGGAFGEDEDIGWTVQASNALTVDDLAGPFNNGSVCAGDLLGGSVDYFTGPSNNGQVVGVGFTAGEGAGFAVTNGLTNTVMCSTS